MAKKPGVQIDLVLEVIIAKYEVRPGEGFVSISWNTGDNMNALFDELKDMGIPTKSFVKYVHATRLG